MASPKPTFINIGAYKCATTWLHDCLDEHPEVFVPDFKELHFFDRCADDRLYDSRDRELFDRAYRGTDDYPARGSCTPGYLSTPQAVAGIREVAPEAKLICLLRDPAERLHSHYWYVVGKYGDPPVDFDRLALAPDEHRDCLDGAVDVGCYGEHLERYLAVFPREQLRIVLVDDIKARPAETFADICRFIGVRDDVRPDALEGKSNAAMQKRSKLLYHLKYLLARGLAISGLESLRRGLKETGVPGLIRRLNTAGFDRPPLEAHHRESLVEFYRPEIRKVETIAGRDLNHWREV